MTTETINIVATFLFILLVVFYVMLTERKTRKLEERLDRQEKLRERTCRKCDNLMIHVHAPDGQTVEFCGFVCEKTRKPVKLDDIKTCYEKPVGIE